MINGIDPRITRTKKDFRLAFSELLSEKDYANISVKDIVSRAGYSRSTFYAHYTDKENFLITIIEEEADICAGIIVEAHKDMKNLRTHTENYLPAIRFFEHVFENQDMFTLLFSSKPIPHMRQIFIEKYTKNIANKIQYSFDGDNENMDFRLYVGAQIYLASAEWWAKCNYKYSATYISELCFKYYCSPANHVNILRAKKNEKGS